MSVINDFKNMVFAKALEKARNSTGRLKSLANQYDFLDVFAQGWTIIAAISVLCGCSLSAYRVISSLLANLPLKVCIGWAIIGGSILVGGFTVWLMMIIWLIAQHEALRRQIVDYKESQE